METSSNAEETCLAVHNLNDLNQQNQLTKEPTIRLTKQQHTQIKSRRDINWSYLIRVTLDQLLSGQLELVQTSTGLQVRPVRRKQ